MTEPAFTISSDDRDAKGRLRPEHLDRIVQVLQAPGFVLLPSDTAYSVATWLNTGEIRDQINRILERSDDAISLAFPKGDELLSEWTEPNPVVKLFLDTFTPGPITVVCRASRLIPDEITEDAWRSQNRTLGVRITDSVVEQQVAEVGRTPVTTVAVRDAADGNRGVTSFARAMEIVQAGIDRIGGATWCAIDGGQLHATGVTSTVVMVEENGHWWVRRPGVIGEDEIKARLNAVS